MHTADPVALEQVPAFTYVRLVVPFAQSGAGGALQIVVRQGSAAQTVLLQPHWQFVCAPVWQTPFAQMLAAVATPAAQVAAAQAVSVVAYEHVPAAHVPALAKVRRVPESLQFGAGGVVHPTPAHGSSAHTVFEHPKAQVVVDPVVQTPAPEQVPAAVARPPVHVGAPQEVSFGG